MIPAVLLLAQVAGAAPPPAAVTTTSAAPRPPQDWSKLPPLHLTTPTPDAGVSLYVRGESDAGRCAAATRSADGWVLRVDMAVLIGADGRARQIVPRAIDCPNVEQYAAGLLSRMTRDSIDTPTGSGDTWFKTSLTFAWTN